MRSWHTATGFGARQGMDLQRGETRPLVEEPWVAGSLAVGAWSTPPASLENPRYRCSRSSVQQRQRPVYRNSIQLQRADNSSRTQISARLTTDGPICCQPAEGG